jgi:hypothetical protein
MRFIAWHRLQWLPPLWGAVGAIIFLLVPLRHELSFLVSVVFVSVGSGLLFFIAKLPLTYHLDSFPSLDGKGLKPVRIE